MSARRGEGARPRVVAAPFDDDARALLAEGLRDGAVMAYPTETFYALGGNALLPAVTDAVYRLKGRGAEKALLLLVDGMAGAEALAAGIDPAAWALMERFWPGPLTLVLRAGAVVPPHLPDARGTVAVRWSPHPVVQALLGLGGVPLIGTSANRSGEAPAQRAEAVRAAFGTGVEVIVDGGPSAGGWPSTVVDTTVRPFRVVRAGALSTAALRETLAEGHGDRAPEDAPA